MSSKQTFILILVAILVVASFIWAGIIYSFMHPSEPKTPEQEFTDSCEYAVGVPDTSQKPWRCIKI